jgi:hypothetical protein
MDTLPLDCEEKAKLMEDLFLSACAKQVQSSYQDLKYKYEMCMECRTGAPGQTGHQCYWESPETVARKRIKAALFALPCKFREVFCWMKEVLYSHEKYKVLSAQDVLEFFGVPDDSCVMWPLEIVCVRKEWKEAIITKVVDNEGLLVPQSGPMPSPSHDEDTTIYEFFR